MTLEKAKCCMDAGLGVLKFSLDAMDRKKIQAIRGKRANFKESVDKIMELLEYKEKNNSIICLHLNDRHGRKGNLI